MVADFHGSVKTFLDERHGLIASGERFVELERALILEGGGKDLIVKSIDGVSVGAGIDIEAVATGEAMSGGGVEPGDEILLVDGILREPEVVSPVEEPFQLIGIEEDSKGTVSPGGHSKQTAGVARTSAAVIDPSCLEGKAVEGRQVRGMRDGSVGHALTDELGLGECVEDGELVIREVFLEASQAVVVFLDVFEAGFVGVVEEALSGKAFGAEEIREFWEKLVQELLIFWRVGRSLPAEAPHAVHENLRGGSGAPLGEGMDHFKALDATLTRKVDVTLQEAEIERVFAIFFSDA